MSDDAVLCNQLRDRNIQLVRRSQEQPLARFGARQLQVVAALADVAARADSYPAAALVLSNSRRFMSFISALVFISLSLAPQRGRAVNCLADAMVGPAPAGIGHLRIDFSLCRLRPFGQQRHSGQDLSRLAVSALRNIELLPGELHRVGSI